MATIPVKDAPQPAPRPVHIFICADCAREEISLHPRLPVGWDRLIDCGGQETVRCPDCNEAIEQRKTAEINRQIIDAAFTNIGGTGISLPTAEAGKYTVAVPRPRTFAVFLERQDAGDYRVAMMPEAVLMRPLPLGFFLTPDEAEALAVELTDFARLARKPGTAPAEEGAK